MNTHWFYRLGLPPKLDPSNGPKPKPSLAQRISRSSRHLQDFRRLFIEGLQLEVQYCSGIYLYSFLKYLLTKHIIYLHGQPFSFNSSFISCYVHFEND